MTSPSSSPESAKAMAERVLADKMPGAADRRRRDQIELARALLATNEENERLRASIPEEREAAAREEREACAKCVPTNWLDPLMDRKFGEGADGRAIEALLLCVAERIRSRSAPGKGEPAILRSPNSTPRKGP